MPETLMLGKDICADTDCEGTQLNNNVIVVGASGSGKTMSYAEMRLLRACDSSLLVTLSKRRLAVEYAEWLAGRGYEVLDLDLTSPEDSAAGFDPMRYVRTARDVTCLARSVVMANPRKARSRDADPFWDDAATSLLSALTAYVMHIRTVPSFCDVLNMFGRLQLREKGDAIETSLDDVFVRLANEDPESFAVRCWKTFRYAPLRTAGSIYTSLSTALDAIFVPELNSLMSAERSVDFSALANRKTVLFVTTSAVNPSLNAFAGLFYSQAVKSLFEYAESQKDGLLPVPVHLLCDDFATGARIPSFEQYISIFREKRISVSILLQSESQLVSMYGAADAQTIINNCDRYIYLGGMDLATCRNVAERAGVPLADVLYMPIGSEFIFERGQCPLRTERWDITADQTWRSLSAQHSDHRAET